MTEKLKQQIDQLFQAVEDSNGIESINISLCLKDPDGFTTQEIFVNDETLKSLWCCLRRSLEDYHLVLRLLKTYKHFNPQGKKEPEK